MGKRLPTPADKAASALIEKTIKASGKSQDAIADEVGVTQGTIWQWMSGMPVSAKRAPALAKAIGISDPARISVAYSQIAAHKTGESQGARLDVAKLAHLIEEVEGAVEMSKMRVPAKIRARLVASLYSSGEAAASVQGLLAALLSSMEEA